MANKLKITESQYKRLKKLLIETADVNHTLDSVKIGDVLKFKTSAGSDYTINVQHVDQNGNEILGDNHGNKIKLYFNSYDEQSKKLNYKQLDKTNQKYVDKTVDVEELDIVRNGKIVDIRDRKVEPTGKTPEPTSQKDNISQPVDLDPNAPIKKPEERTDAERQKTIKKYYDEIINDPNLKQAFYKAPSFWNYITAAIKGEPAEGKGIGPALNLVNKYKNQESLKKAPGFTTKQNQTAKFQISKSVNIDYVTENNVKGSVGISNGAENNAIVQQNTTIGNNALKTLVSSNGKYKLDVLERTKTPNVFMCVFSVYGVTGVKNDEVYSGKVNVRFTQSLGYNEETNTTK
jgi:hypothetical protein